VRPGVERVAVAGPFASDGGVDGHGVRLAGRGGRGPPQRTGMLDGLGAGEGEDGVAADGGFGVGQADEQVVALDVRVREVALVEEVEGEEQLAGDVLDDGQRQRLVAVEEAPQTFAFNLLHEHDVLAAAFKQDQLQEKDIWKRTWVSNGGNSRGR
jgi:hypothetical protein